MRDERDARVLNAACDVALELGLSAVTRRAVAARAGVATGTVSLTVGNAAGLRDAIVREAIKRPMLTVLAQALAIGHDAARQAPDDLKNAALRAVSQ